VIAEHDCFQCLRARHERFDFAFECHPRYFNQMGEQELKYLSEEVLAKTKNAWRGNIGDPLSDSDIIVLADSLSRLFIYFMSGLRRKMKFTRYIKLQDIKELEQLFYIGATATLTNSISASVVFYMITGKMLPISWCWGHCIRRKK